MKVYFRLFLLFAIISLWGCYPKGPEFIQDLDIALTHRSPTFDFDEHKTFFIYDSINWVTNVESFEPDRAFEIEIIREVIDQMKARGYDSVSTIADTVDYTNPANPDLIMVVSGIYSRNSGTVWYPIGGWGWGYGWGWGWGWGGWVPSTYSYTTGSVIMNLGYFKGGDPVTDRFPLTWEGAINGLASSSNSNNQSRVIAGIGQAFEQSPYIQASTN